MFRASLGVTVSENGRRQPRVWKPRAGSVGSANGARGPEPWIDKGSRRLRTVDGGGGGGRRLDAYDGKGALKRWQKGVRIRWILGIETSDDRGGEPAKRGVFTAKWGTAVWVEVGRMGGRGSMGGEAP